MGDVLVQLSDLHVQVGPGDAVAAERVRRTIELVRGLEPSPAALLLSGDLVNTGTEAEYERLGELLGELLEWGPAVLPMVGNHDDRELLRATLGGRGNVVALGEQRHLQYAWQGGSLRVLVLDTQHTGHDDGKLCDTRHAWLVDQLDAEPDTPTIVAMHHPPVSLGMPRFDEIMLRADHADRLREVLLAHRQVELVACGHVHRAATARFAHAPLFACPSVFWPARPDFVGQRPIELLDGPVGFGMHVRTRDGHLASHARLVPRDE